jgi:hypothetical protein
VKRRRHASWNAPLTHTVSILRGPTLKTLAHSRTYILKLPKTKQARWEIAVRCPLQAAESGSAEDIKAATRAIELAFLYQGQLPNRNCVPNWQVISSEKRAYQD